MNNTTKAKKDTLEAKLEALAKEYKESLPHLRRPALRAQNPHALYATSQRKSLTTISISDFSRTVKDTEMTCL
jgi:hypothetical protein